MGTAIYAVIRSRARVADFCFCVPNEEALNIRICNVILIYRNFYNLNQENLNHFVPFRIWHESVRALLLFE